MTRISLKTSYFVIKQTKTELSIRKSGGLKNPDNQLWPFHSRCVIQCRRETWRLYDKSSLKLLYASDNCLLNANSKQKKNDKICQTLRLKVAFNGYHQ